ncbi:MAG: hypothetical protein HC926_05400 [Synechococcaceae cyanobacterium SM2_3_60]|nr:hypothetical protein [Synechococcaceae cyanobacterium SM2_3_60]
MSEALPLIPLRDTVVFPHLVVPLLIGRSRSLSALEAAVSEHEQQVIVVAQKVDEARGSAE